MEENKLFLAEYRFYDAKHGFEVQDEVLSYGILAATTLLVALASVRVYRLATLRYGQKLNFFKLLFGK